MMNGCDSGCDEADEDPACGCEPIAEGCEDACDSPAGAKCSGLLAKLFSTCSDKGCDSAMQARKQESQHADAKSQHADVKSQHADVSQLVVLLLQ